MPQVIAKQYPLQVGKVKQMPNNTLHFTYLYVYMTLLMSQMERINITLTWEILKSAAKCTGINF